MSLPDAFPRRSSILLRLEVEARACVAIEQIFALFSSGVLAMHDEHEFVSLMMNDKALMLGESSGSRLMGTGLAAAVVGTASGLTAGGGGGASFVAELSPAGIEERRLAALQAFAPAPVVDTLSSAPMLPSTESPHIEPVADPVQPELEPEPEREPESSCDHEDEHENVQTMTDGDPLATPNIVPQCLTVADRTGEHGSPHNDDEAELRQPPPVSTTGGGGSRSAPRSKEELRASVAGLSESDRSAALVSILDAAAGSGDDMLLSAVMELLNEGVARKSD